MATEQSISNLKLRLDYLNNLDRKNLLRDTLGEESLKAFAPTLELINKKLNFAIRYASDVNDSTISQTNSIFEQINNSLEAQVKRNNVEYVTQRQNFLTNIDNLLEQLKGCFPPFVTAAVESRGFLEDEGVRKEYEKAVESMQEKANQTLNEVEGRAKKVIDEASNLASKIENRARDTAKGISIKDAQEQFSNAQDNFDFQVYLWGGLSLGFILFFLYEAFHFEGQTIDASFNTAQMVYHTAVRLSILTVIGAVATFCLKILRASLHMREQNLHKQRIANSVSSFVQSAETPEQRDLILGKLVDFIAQFGNSGLVSGQDDNISPAKLSVDSIARSINFSSGSK